jgi:hypothetical protein
VSPAVAVIVPWRGGCQYRERAWEHLKGHYEWPVIEALGSEPWCKAAAVMPAIEATRAQIVVVVDADVWCDGLHAAIVAVQDGAAWAHPHEFLHRLTHAATRNVLSGRPDDATEEPPYRGKIGGGIVVARRETLLEVPLDSRFVGWGQEDESWGWALTTLVGEPWCGTADLIHFWHPPQQRLDRKLGSMDGWRLKRRYAKARRDPVVKRRLIEEVHLESHQPPEPPSADHPPTAIRDR